MKKFMKFKDEDNRFDHTNVVVETDSASLGEIVGAFYEFMLACGFTHDGLAEYLDIEATEEMRLKDESQFHAFSYGTTIMVRTHTEGTKMTVDERINNLEDQIRSLKETMNFNTKVARQIKKKQEEEIAALKKDVYELKSKLASAQNFDMSDFMRNMGK